MRRALPIHWPAVRISLGKSLGPTTTSATIRSIRSSLQPMSNMTGPLPYKPRALMVDLVFVGIFDRFVLMVRTDRTRLIFGVIQALFEAVDPLGHIAHEIRNLATAAKQKNGDNRQNQN